MLQSLYVELSIIPKPTGSHTERNRELYVLLSYPVQFVTHWVQLRLAAWT